MKKVEIWECAACEYKFQHSNHFKVCPKCDELDTIYTSSYIAKHPEVIEKRIDYAILELQKIARTYCYDPESAHIHADDVIIAFLPKKLREAYREVQDKTDGWWFA